MAKFSLRNRALVALVTISIAVFGALSLGGLKQELMPELQLPQLIVVSSYPGASPEVVSQDVSTPIETAIQSVPDLESTVATSSTGLSMITATFEYGTDLARAEQKITQAVSRIKNSLPDEVDDPQVFSFSLSDLPIMQVAVSGGADRTVAQLADLVNDDVVPELERLDGVREAGVLGATGERVTITPNTKNMDKKGVTTQDVMQVLGNNGVLVAAGEITTKDITMPVQAGRKLTTLKDVQNLVMPITTTDAFGIPSVKSVKLSDVASVKITENPRTSISRVNGVEALTMSINKLPSANTVDVAHAVEERLAELSTDIPGLRFDIVFNQAPFIEHSIESLTSEGLLGLLFAVIVILLFLFSFRSTIVTAISIPASVLVTLIGIGAAGYTLNVLTLGALTIAIGRVVDDSIVVIENIKRHYGYGKERAESILDAVKEVAAAITASTITTVAVFLPLVLVDGMVGELFRPFAFTVTLALLSSLVVSLTIVPVLAYWFVRPSKRDIEHAEHGESLDVDARPETMLQRGYVPVLKWTLRHPIITLLIAVLTLGGTVVAAQGLETNFIGDSGSDAVNATQRIPQELSLDAAVQVAEVGEAAVRAVDGVEAVQVSVGSRGSAIVDAISGGQGSISYAITVADGYTPANVREAVRLALETTVENKADITVSAAAGMGFSSDIELIVTGNNRADAEEGANRVLEAVRNAPGIAQATTDMAETRPMLEIAVKRNEAAKRGLTESQLTNYVSQLMSPTMIGRVEISDQLLTVYLKNPKQPSSITALRQHKIDTVKGKVRLDKLVTVRQIDAPVSITTVRGERSVTVTVSPSMADLGTASTTINEALDTVALPQGVRVEIGGVLSDQADAFSQLGIALLVAILIVYIVMVATFRSLLQPFLLLISVPFAATGVIGLQIISGIPLGVPSLIGVLMLVGIVVTNAIVLIDLVNQYRDRGLKVREALILGGSRRLRPILMTALATILALTPMATGITGQGGFISQPLGIVVIGGLVSSTVLTLIVLPVIYQLVEGTRENFRDNRPARIARRAERAAARKQAPVAVGAGADVAAAAAESASDASGDAAAIDEADDSK